MREGKDHGARVSPGARSRTGKEAGGGGETWPRSAVMRARSSSYWQELEEAPGGWAGGLGREKLGQATGRPVEDSALFLTSCFVIF